MEVHEHLAARRQQHLLRHWDELSGEQREHLTQQVLTIDFDLIDRLLRLATKTESPVDTPSERAGRATPPSNLVRLPRCDGDRAERLDAAQYGEQLLAAGKIGVLLVAGGQGSRLGFPHAKGMFPIGPVSDRSLFQLLAEQLLTRSRRSGISIPYYVMTSDATHEETVMFFHEHAYFGLEEIDVRFFQQASMPSVDAATGQLLLADKERVALSPDGHGGMLAAMSNAGLLDDMRSRGVEYLYYHQVDNPTAIVCDPEFLGLHAVRKSEMSTKVVAKRSAGEKMGVAVDVDGQTQIIEYSDLPDDVAARIGDDGQPLLWAGNMAIHVFDRQFLERIAARSDALPYHVAKKLVEHIDESGQVVAPATENAYKFERFIFDALPLAKAALVVEADRAREFNAVKNKDGDDSPQTAKAALTRIYSEWLREAGARVTDRIDVEISPLFAIDAEQVCCEVSPGLAVSESTVFDEDWRA